MLRIPDAGHSGAGTMLKRTVQVLGAKLADAALAVLIIAGHEEIVAGLLALVGVIDLVLIWLKVPTISRVVWRQHTPKTDVALMLGWLTAILIVRGLNPACWYTIGVIHGHWHWPQPPEPGESDAAPDPAPDRSRSRSRSRLASAAPLAILLLLLPLLGCGSAPKPPAQMANPKPESSAALETVVEKVDSIHQKVDQVTVAVSEQTQNWGLDARRAEVEAERNRNLLRSVVAGGMILMGLALLCLCSPAITVGWMTYVLIGTAILLIIGPGAVLVWSM
jgi:hypothetical protein